MRRKNVFRLLLAALCLTGMLLPASSQAAKNKGLRYKRSFAAATEENFINRNIVGNAVFAKKSKLTKKMTLSGTIYVPAKAVASVGDVVIIEPCVAFAKTSGKNFQDKYVGMIQPKMTLRLERLSKKKVVLKRQNPSTGKVSSIGKYGSVKKKGSYYVVRFQKVPLAKKYSNPGAGDNELRAINTKKAYMVAADVNLHSTAKKKWSAYLYLDQLTLKAGISQTITFDKKDYRETGSYTWDGNAIPNQVKAIPSK